MADKGSSRKSRNREHEEAPLGATLGDHVSIGVRRETPQAICERADEIFPIALNRSGEIGDFSAAHNRLSALPYYPKTFAPLQKTAAAQ